MITRVVTITDFQKWLNDSDNYKNYFSYEGAEALFNYLEDLSDELGTPLEFDPIAWCVEYSEYSNFKQFKSDTGYYNTQDKKKYDGYPDIETLDDLKNYTEVIEFDNGLIIRDF